jgi:hypothetical protein
MGSRKYTQRRPKQIEYLDRAKEAQDKAERTNNPELKQNWTIARQWIELAKSAERSAIGLEGPVSLAAERSRRGPKCRSEEMIDLARRAKDEHQPGGPVLGRLSKVSPTSGPPFWLT